MFATNHQLGYPRWKTMNHFPSIHAHFQDGVGCVSPLFLPLEAGKTSFMDLCNQSPVRLTRCNTKNNWRSFDTHCQDGAVSVSLLFLPQKAPNTSLMDVFNQSPLRLPNMESQKSLSLGWCLYSEWGSDLVAVSVAYKGCQYVSYT